MTDADRTPPPLRGGRVRAVGARLVAALLLAASAALQVDASLQRWVTARSALPVSRRDAIESHEFDHGTPTAGWVPIGDAAERHGVGMILLALAVVALAVAVGAGGWTGALVTLAVAGPFALAGAHALRSGLAGAPSPLAGVLLLPALLGLAGLVAVAVIRPGRAHASLLDAVALVLLTAPALPGYLFAAFLIAPLIHGDTSYDTTPWTETVIGAEVGLGALVLLVAAAAAALSRGAARPRMHRRSARGGARGAADPLPLEDEH
ncbi:hypothetical protein QFZ62_000884 [Clavibacter sp. B3I6]|uniref:hypothetical protein n=1 Tax=Clavibacter sp. B3I6 TaxID=3042268 RepID=UPI002784300A|nr:hypothetical protein [Clavibacter sp. B3I6]MDQ0743576.1 hypothetical protein [Clavibacter sp. B3I6]